MGITNGYALLDDLQRQMHTEYELFNVLCGCEEMIANDGNIKAVTAYMGMALHFYGKKRIVACSEKYGFKTIQRLLQGVQND